MSAGGHMAAMQATIKNNNRKKGKNKPFKNYVAKYTKGRPIFSKKLSFQEKRELLLKLKTNRELESKQNRYKLVISFGVTILVISGIVFTIKLAFF